MSMIQVIENIERSCDDRKKENQAIYSNFKFPHLPNVSQPKVESGEDVLVITVGLGKDTRDIPLLMVARKDRKEMSILKVFQREEAIELYEKLIGIEKNDIS